MDLTLSKKIGIEKVPVYYEELHHVVDPADENTFEHLYIETELPYVLSSFERCLLVTQEWIDIRLDKAGIFCLRSTWARHGLIIPPTVAYPGWSGELEIEVFNSSRYAIQLQPGFRIGSLITIDGRDVPVYRGQYQNQSGITLPKVGSL